MVIDAHELGRETANSNGGEYVLPRSVLGHSDTGGPEYSILVGITRRYSETHVDVQLRHPDVVNDLPASGMQRSQALEAVFRELADEWYEETADSSLIGKKITHPAYYKIIGLGPDVVRLLLRELRERPSYWFWALHSITRENPVRPGANFRQAVDDWLAWGRAGGLIN